MGACNLEEVFDFDLSVEDIKDKFNQMCRDDRVEFGPDPYSGSWATIPNVLVHDKVLRASVHDAARYCLDHAEKWEHAVAVRFEDGEKRGWVIAGWAAC